jgi:hypothetical protein
MHFKSPFSFSHFEHDVTRQRRYVRTPESEEFLRVVASQCKSRITDISSDSIFFRAQLGNAWEPHASIAGIKIPVPHPASRMKPLRESAFEGRVNPKGIPCLYLATTPETALSEVRPWIDAHVSLALFKTTSPLKVVDCSLLHGRYFDLISARTPLGPVPPVKVDEIVWAAIDGAFSEPVTRTDDTADYAATQIIADLFRSEGYSGVTYKSAFGVGGYNVALFDLDSANHIRSELHKVKSINYEFAPGP